MRYVGDRARWADGRGQEGGHRMDGLMLSHGLIVWERMARLVDGRMNEQTGWDGDGKGLGWLGLVEDGRMWESVG